LWDPRAEHLWVEFQGWFSFPTGIISFIGLLLNSLAIATFVRWRKADKKLSSGGVHLLTLAVSDITCNLAYAMGFVFRLLVENNLILRNSTILRSTFTEYWRFTGTINRFLTLFITLTRFRVLFFFRQAYQMDRMTEREHIRETICFGILPGAILGVLGGISEIKGKISGRAEGGYHD
jgi:hypothetical protein